MTNQVYANGREIACKAGSGKTICAFPDVCFTPPENPATPPGVPVPYPNTGFDADTTEGTKNVKISGKEVMQKDSSYFKTSTGDEAGCAAKKGVITSKNVGKVYFNAWSMDVKFEGENVDRHLDLTTNNHASKPGDTPPWPFAASMAIDAAGKTEDPCAKDKEKEEKACKDYKPHKKDGKDVCEETGLGSGFTRAKGATTTRAKAANTNPCSAARRCKLVPFNGKDDGINGCCPAQTPDHIVPKSSFFETSVDAGDFVPGWENYKINEAPCMCLEGGSCSGTHGLRHAHHKAFGPGNGTMRSFNAEVKHCAASAKAVAPQCDEACIEAQLKEGHKGMGDQRKQVKHSCTGKNLTADEIDVLKAKFTGR
jgi:hypothetical protein